ncbi:unnamed protein product, partial [Rotaria magnacalcarata]
LKIDQIREMNQNLIEELNHLAETLLNFTTIFYNICPKINNIQYQNPIDTYLFQSVSTPKYPNNNNHINEIKPTTTPHAANSNCYLYNIIRNPCPTQYNGLRQDCCNQTNPIYYPMGTIPTIAKLP